MTVKHNLSTAAIVLPVLMLMLSGGLVYFVLVFSPELQQAIPLAQWPLSGRILHEIAPWSAVLGGYAAFLFLLFALVTLPFARLLVWNRRIAISALLMAAALLFIGWLNTPLVRQLLA